MRPPIPLFRHEAVVPHSPVFRHEVVVRGGSGFGGLRHLRGRSQMAREDNRGKNNSNHIGSTVGYASRGLHLKRND